MSGFGISSSDVDVKATGTAVRVPDDPVARLMYYLSCITLSVGLDILHDDLVDWRNWRRLSRKR